MAEVFLSPASPDLMALAETSLLPGPAPDMTRAITAMSTADTNSCGEEADVFIPSSLRRQART
jgi:hypothetical protein